MDATPRTMGLVGATALIVGSVIGSGIFLTPALVAGQVSTPGLFLLVWAVGGALSLMAALTVAELGAMFPRAGGQYVFLREAYGDGAAFLFGWMALAVAYTGTVAAIAVACAGALGAIFGFGGFAVKFVAIAVIWLLTGMNALGLRYASGLQVASTVAKVAALALLVAFGLAIGSGPEPGFGEGDAAQPLPLASAFGLALVGVLFAYDGMASATFVGGEIRDPGKTIPRASILGALVVVVVYLAVNLAFLFVLPMAQLADNPDAPAAAGRALFGAAGGVLIAAAVALTTFGTANGWILQSPRIYYGMARDGWLYRGFGRLSARAAAPVFGLVIQAEWASLLVLSGSFEQLITYVVMSSFLFYAFTGLALFRLRKTRPDHPRPYRAWGYPWVPALFVASSLLIVVNSLVFDTLNALIGVTLALSGVPIHWWLRKRRPAAAG